MNSVHDCGGMDGFGPVIPPGYDGTEPVFKSEWERRMLAVFMATIGPFYSDDEFRQSRECLEPAKYLTRSYYEQWWFAVTRLMLEKALVVPQALAARLSVAQPDPAPEAAPLDTPPLDAAQMLAALRAGATTRIDDATRTPGFAVGQRVLTRNLNPPTHTRLPRYCRGKKGEVVKVHGLFALPDVRALGDEDTRQWCYAVRFTLRELWGEEAAAGDSLTIDLWDSYLVPGPAGDGA